MTKHLLTASFVSALALAVQFATPAQAATGLESWDIKPLSVDADGTKTHRAIIDTTGDIPDSVGLDLTATSTEGDDVSVSMTSPHSGSVSTSGSLELQIQPDGGTATLVFLGLGDGSAIGDEFEVTLPLHPDDGGAADVVFSEGEGVISASLTPIEGEVDTYSVELSFDFNITGDVAGLEYFDMTVQETDGDVSVIDEQAELAVNSSDLRWRTTFETSSTSLGSVDYDGTASITDGGVTTDADTFSTAIADVDPDDGAAAHFGLSSVSISIRNTSKPKASGSGTTHKLIVQGTAQIFEEDVPTASFTLTDEDGDEIASITPTVNRTVSGFFVPGIEFDDSAVGSTLSVSVDMMNADGEVVATDTFDAKVRAEGSSRTNAKAAIGEAYVWGYQAAELDDGTVGVSINVGGTLADDIVDVDIAVSTNGGADLTDETSFSAERESRLVQYRGKAVVDADYEGVSLDFVGELSDGSGEVVSTVERAEKPKPKRLRRVTFRRSMKTNVNDGPRYYPR